VLPDYPPRARVEWVIAGARVVLAVGGLFAIWLDPSTHSRHESLIYALLVMYLLHSAATLALVWKPLEFARGWGLFGHVFDLAVFSVVMFLTQGTSSPFYVYFVFSVICGALRWEAKGALLTAAAVIAVYTLISASEFFSNPAFELDRAIIRVAQLAVTGALLAYVGSYHPRTLREVLRFASWPHLVPEHENDAVADIIERAKDILPAPAIVLVWRERDEEYVNLAWATDTGVEWIRESRDAYEPMVAASLRRASFQARDAADPGRHVDFWHKGRFRDFPGAPINEALRKRFDMHAVQSSAIDGGLVEGRLFWLGRRHMRIDDLIVGDLVASLAASRLESAYLVASHRETAALNERLRVARDLHDGLLQSLAGTALQLAVASRVLDRDREAARRGIQEAQNQLEQSEREIRGIITRLRPQADGLPQPSSEPLIARLNAFARRIEDQWQVQIGRQVTTEVERLPAPLKQHLLLMVQEAVLNAARHAKPRTIQVSIAMDARSASARVIDDGKGFSFTGSYDLESLTALDVGPLTLRERVTELRGDLNIQSGPSGSTVRITLPVPQSALAYDAHHTRPR
jgi:signal transduction histidine kinase